MTVKELASKLSLTFLSGEEISSRREIDGCYCGDLLSWVMSKAKSGNVWLTVMGNINSVGVAALAELSCIILTENAPLDEDAKKKADLNGIIILAADGNTYETAAKMSRMI